jgi:hypothetical protein
MFFARLINSPKILPIISIIFLLLTISNLQKSHYDRSTNSEVATNYFQQERVQKQSLQMQQSIPTLGFNNLLADRQYLSFVQYFGDRSARETTGHSLVSDYFETIVSYDPQFIDAYITLANANSVYAANPEQTVALMNQVLRSISPEASGEANLLWTSKGIDELIFLGDTKAAEKSYQMAAIWADKTKSDRTQNIIDRNLKMAQFLATNPDTREAQIRAWSMVLPNIKDEAHRQRVINKIETLKAQLSNSTTKSID